MGVSFGENWVLSCEDVKTIKKPPGVHLIVRIHV